jgi:hypothetical protein
MAFRIATLLAVLLQCDASSQADPALEHGLPIMLLPAVAAGLGGKEARFAAPGGKRTFADAQQLLRYFRTLPATTQEKGIWIFADPPMAYSPSDREKLLILLDLCHEEQIPISTSKLPAEWNGTK